MNGTCRPHKGFTFIVCSCICRENLQKFRDFKAVTNLLPFCTKCALDKDGNICHFQ